MQIVKVSTPWSHIDFTTRISKQFINPKFKFDFSETCNVCDYWIVWGGIKKETEKVYCDPKNVIYITDEVHSERYFNQKFLNQFSAVITCRTDLNHKFIIPSHELNTWMIEKDYDWLIANEDIQKTKNISVVCSDQTWLPGHKLRYAFVNKLIGHFKDKLDVFGRGFNPINDKFEALSTYKYSIAIENSVTQGYFTEKITDCYLSNTLPLYYGCPNIEDFFDKNSLLLINPNNYIDSILKIEELIEMDQYQDLLPSIVKAKKKYLTQFHIFNKLPQIFEQYFHVSNTKKNTLIKNESVFKSTSIIKKIFYKIYQ
jgi:Glycosyltransferase family 10 (fucosyltransferase) C-term